MGASSRNKGNAGEREWAEHVRAGGWPEAHRALGQARDGGGDVPVPPVLYEVKRRRKAAVRQFLDQAIKAMPKYKGCTIPAVALREDGRTDWMVILPAKDFLALLRRASIL
jgi:hypothetical protein